MSIWIRGAVATALLLGAATAVAGPMEPLKKAAIEAPSTAAGSTSMLSDATTATRPSEASLDRLLRAMKEEQAMEGIRKQFDMSFRTSLEIIKEQHGNKEDYDRWLDVYQAKYTAVVDQWFSWDTIKPIYMQMYGEVYSQKEVDDQITFFESPAGMAFTDKMPLLMKKSGDFMQEQVGTMLQQLQQIESEMLEEMQGEEERGSQ